MQIYREELIKLYLEENKDKFPNYTEKQIKQVILSQTKAIKRFMESSDIPHIRLKYFGMFRPLYGRLIFYKKNIFDKGITAEHEIGRYEEIFKKVKKRFPDGFRKSKID